MNSMEVSWKCIDKGWLHCTGRCQEDHHCVLVEVGGLVLVSNEVRVMTVRHVKVLQARKSTQDLHNIYIYIHRRCSGIELWVTQVESVN